MGEASRAGSVASERGSDTVADSGFTLGGTTGTTYGGDTGSTLGAAPTTAQLRLEGRQEVTLAYDVTTAADRIAVQFSDDGSTWRETDHTVSSGSVVTGGDTVTFRTGYQYVRAVPGRGYTDSQVNTVELSAKG
jgi:hypothetical protein